MKKSFSKGVKEVAKKTLNKAYNKTVQAIKNPEESTERAKWQRKLDDAKAQYSEEIAKMNLNEAYYNGTREVQSNPNSNKRSSKVASNVWNITYELIESQVDPSIPYPKVTAIHEEDMEKAKLIEKALINEIRNLKLASMNDLQERTTPVMGADYMHVEWDNDKGYHSTMGGVAISSRSPKQIIPQPGVTCIEDMDYLFMLTTHTKKAVKKKYGVDVSLANEESPELRGVDAPSNDDLVTVNTCYYRNDEGNIGIFTWCDDYVLENIYDYQARQMERCKKCGEPKDGDECKCGSKSFEMAPEKMQQLTKNIETGSGMLQAIMVDEAEEIDPMTGEAVLIEREVPVEIPYYQPNCIPIVIRKNVSKANRLIGVSDIDVIRDQQDNVKKLGTKINEKVYGGGSIVTLPKTVNVVLDETEMKVVRVSNQNELQMIKAIDLKPDVTVDRILINDEYQRAKSSLGITDSFQGKYDPSATSGVAKQYSINQAAGRMESKKAMKNDAYAKLYQMIFEFWLAYADQKIPFQSIGQNGEQEFSYFDRYQFLKQDDAGEWYWNDEFIFETDPTSTIMSNREAMWQQIDFKLQSGAFGTLADPNTNLRYWKYMEKNGYPNAGEIKKDFEAEVQRKMQQEEMLMQMQAQQGQPEQAQTEQPMM